MTTPEHIVRVLKILLSPQTWSAQTLERALHWRMARLPNPPAKAKEYGGDLADPFFESAVLQTPVYGGKLGARVMLHVHANAHVPFADLKRLLPPSSVGGVQRPAIGTKGAAVVRTWRQWNGPGGEVSMTFVRQLPAGQELLSDMNVRRSRPDEPQDFETPEGYRVLVHLIGSDQGYVIERNVDRSEAILITHAELQKQQLMISYRCVDNMIADPLARKLIRKLLAEGSLKDQLRDVEKILYAELEGGETVSELCG